MKRYSFCLFFVVSQSMWHWVGWEQPEYFRLIFHICTTRFNSSVTYEISVTVKFILCQTIIACFLLGHLFNSLRPRPNRRHFADDIFKCIFENENELISPRISLKFVPKVRINNIPALVHIMAWRRPGDKPLSEPMMVNLLTHICVTRPQWVNSLTARIVLVGHFGSAVLA